MSRHKDRRTYFLFTKLSAVKSSGLYYVCVVAQFPL
jgi:hypothetical protein